MVWVTIQIGKGYLPNLAQRMRQYRITKGELCRTMEPPFDRSHFSRFYTKDKARKVSPTMDTVERIENAMVKLIALRDKPKTTFNRRGSA